MFPRCSRPLHPIHRLIDTLFLPVHVPHEGRETPVPGEGLEGFQIGLGAGESGNRGVPESVRDDCFWVHASRLDDARKWLAHSLDVAGLRRFTRENPAVLVLCHIMLADKYFHEAPWERLLAPPPALDLNPQAPAYRVKVIKSAGQNFPVPHTGAKPDFHEQPNISVAVGQSRFQEGHFLVIGQNVVALVVLGVDRHQRHWLFCFLPLEKPARHVVVGHGDPVLGGDGQASIHTPLLKLLKCERGNALKGHGAEIWF